jgi:hypothetical protein
VLVHVRTRPNAPVQRPAAQRASPQLLKARVQVGPKEPAEPRLVDNIVARGARPTLSYAIPEHLLRNHPDRPQPRLHQLRPFRHRKLRASQPKSVPALRLLLSFMILHVQFVHTGASNIVQLTMALERRSPMQRYTLTGRERPTVALGDVQDRQAGVAGLLTTFAFLSQAVKTWRTRSADDLRVPTLLMLVVGIGLWTIYGVMRAAPSIWLWKRYHNGIDRFHPEREVTTGAAKFKLRHYLCSRAL